MDTIKVVDARMGRGKSNAAINYINAHRREKRFLYVTPYLAEVARVRDACNLEEPTEGDKDDPHTKLSELRGLIYQGKSVSTTHSLFENIDDEMLDLIRDKRYTLIIDETVDVIDKPQITSKDRELLDIMTTTDDNGMISWIDPEYTGKFNGYKSMADKHTLYLVDTALINTFNLNLLEAFDDVFILTYLFRGSMLEAFLRCFGFRYEIWGIGYDGGAASDGDLGGKIFVPGEDRPEPVDYRGLIRIVDNPRMNDIGDPYHSLAKNWYIQRSYHHDDMIQLRRNMQNFFKNISHSTSRNRLWTCFVGHQQKLIPDDGSYAGNFLQMMARATNSYSGCSNLAYMINRFHDPNLVKFLANRGFVPDRDQCALSDMLQWIWRSSIRNGKPINLYVPSRRMRELLIDWMDRVADGDAGGVATGVAASGGVATGVAASGCGAAAGACGVGGAGCKESGAEGGAENAESKETL